MSKKQDMNLLDSELSNQMLQSIFAACDVEPNTIALEELESYSNYRRDRYAVRKIIVILIMIIFLLIPLLFIAPSISTLEQLDSDTTAYHLSIDSLLPITSVTATIDGKKVPITEESRGEYTIRPESDGEMIATVKCVNRQYDQKKIKVSALDKEPPVMVDSNADSDSIVITVEDTGVGVDWAGAYAESSDGTKHPPVSYNEKKGTIEFNRISNPVHLVIPDKAGNKLQLVLSI